MRLWIAALYVILILALVPWTLADIRTVPPGGTVFIGEENLDISGSGVSPGSQLAWWAPGTSLDETPADTVTVSSPTSFSALSASFSGREGIWYSLAGKTPVMKIKKPKIRVKITDTTSDFDATGKWLPRGHLASFQIESNLYELRSRGGLTGAPVDIIIISPEKTEYSAVSGPSGSFSLTGIPVSSALYDTGPVWNTGGIEAGTYTIQAKCTANELDSNSADPGTGVSEIVTVLIQDINPLSGSGKQVEIEAGSDQRADTGSDTTGTGEQKVTQTPTVKKTPVQTLASGAPVPVHTSTSTAAISPAGTIPATLPPTPVPVVSMQTTSATESVQPIVNATRTPTIPPSPAATPVPATASPTPTQASPLPVGVVLSTLIVVALLHTVGRR